MLQRNVQRCACSCAYSRMKPRATDHYSPVNGDISEILSTPRIMSNWMIIFPPRPTRAVAVHRSKPLCGWCFELPNWE